MPAVCFYFQVHQPHRLRRYSVFDTDERYVDDAKNAEIMRKVAEKCYRPATRVLLEQVRRHAGAFRIAFSLSGTALEQMESYAPDALESFRALVATGHVELLNETYHHSLACLYSPAEFEDQVRLHARKVHSVFGQTPTVFRNTELLYSNAIVGQIAALKDASGKGMFNAMLCEGTVRELARRSAGWVYRPPGDVRGRDGRPFALLTKNYRLSDDIAFRFSNRAWEGWPMTPQAFAKAIADQKADEVVNLFMDFETFGEHQWSDTGIFDFLSGLPSAVLAQRGTRFLTPSEVAREHETRAVLDVPNPTSWADTERDASAWCGNAMQQNALAELFALEKPIKHLVSRAGGQAEASARAILLDWRRLTTSDHAYYMSTKWFADGDVHQYFSPYESPYDSYINFMNVLDSLRARVDRLGGVVASA